MKTLFTAFDAPGIDQENEETPQQLHERIEAQLREGISHFYFRKKDGTIREAYGTLNKALLERILGPTENDSSPSGTTASNPVFQNYFDLTAKDKKGGIGDWRRYDIENLVAIF